MSVMGKSLHIFFWTLRVPGHKLLGTVLGSSDLSSTSAEMITEQNRAVLLLRVKESQSPRTHEHSLYFYYSDFEEPLFHFS